MANEQRRSNARGPVREVETAGATRAAAPKADTSKKEFRVAPGHTVTAGEAGENEGDPVRLISYGPGQTVKLTDAEARQCGAAVMPAERRASRDGQTSRLKQRIAELEALVDQQKEASSPKGRKAAAGNREEALESLRQRGDNHAGRGEPTPFVASSETIANHEALADQAFLGDMNEGLASDDDETGLRGFGRSNVGGPDGGAIAPAGTGPEFEQKPPSQGSPESLKDSGEKKDEK